MQLCRKLFCQTSAYTSRDHADSVSMWVCASTFHTDQHLSGTSRKFCHKHLEVTIKASPLKVGASQLTALCRKRIRVSAGGYSQLLARQSHASGPTGSEGEAHTCSVSSVAWVSHSTETNKDTCSHTPAITLRTKKKNRLGSLCCENELR